MHRPRRDGLRRQEHPPKALGLTPPRAIAQPDRVLIIDHLYLL
jgi:hypothetical protein